MLKYAPAKGWRFSSITTVESVRRCYGECVAVSSSFPGLVVGLNQGKNGWFVERMDRMTTAVRKRYHEWQPVIPNIVPGTRILQLVGWSAERIGDRFPRVSFGCSDELNCFLA